MKKIILLFVACSFFSTHAQRIGNSPCQNEILTALKHIYGTNAIIQDVTRGLEQLKALANQNCTEAQYQMGLLYYKSSGNYRLNDNVKYQNIYNAFKNTDKAFSYVNKAAQQNHIKSIVLLGNLYKSGYGCKLDYNKAFQLYEKAYELGDPSAAFLIGYCYYKGLGSVEQNYSKAIEWFKKTNYPMSNHFLAVCNYFGHGMPVNKDRALELLISNQLRIKNSKTLLKHLETSYDKGVEGVLSDFKGSSAQKETENINKVLTATTDSKLEVAIAKDIDQQLKPSSLEGVWRGKLIDLDYSGERIMRSFPASFLFNKDSDTNGVAYKATINGKTSSDIGILLDNNLYFNNFEISFPVLYKDYENENEHQHLFLSADLELKKINHTRYLTAYIESKNNSINEPASPKLLILTNTSIKTDNGVEISESLINALLEEQGSNFISLYPNPFKTDLLIQYNLEEDATTSVELHSLDGITSKTIVSNEQQTQGKKLYHFDGTALKNGVYIIRVTVNNKVFTKIILKQ